MWAANKKQWLREKEKAYISIRGKKIKAKDVLPHSDSCRFECKQNFTETDRLNIHNDFWSPSNTEKSHYFAMTMTRFLKQRCHLGRQKLREKKTNNKCVSRTDTNPPFAFQTAFPQGTYFSVSTGRVKKLHMLLVSLYF